jgi:hypothetical protein
MVVTAIIVSRYGEVTGLMLNTAMTEEFLIIAIEDDAVLARVVCAYGIIRKGFCRMEIEDKQKPSPLKSNDLVFFMLARNIRLKHTYTYTLVSLRRECGNHIQIINTNLRRAEPMIMRLGYLHGSVPFVKIFVPQ